MSMFEKLPEEWKAFILKTIIPALIAVSIKIAIQAKEAKVTILQVIVSFVCGIGFAYIFSDYIDQTFFHPWHSVVIAMVAISGEKIGHYFVYKIRLDDLIDAILKIFNIKK